MKKVLSWPLAIIVAIYCVAPGSAQQASQPLQVAITFDDLPAHGPLPPGEFRPEPIRSILATLKREQMPPTYGFVNGFRMVKYPYQMELLREWHASGNPLGNHTWSHPELDKTAAEKYEANIARDEKTLRRVDPDGDWHWFRYPYLEEGETVEKREAVRGWLTAHNYRIAEVSIDFQDYMWNDAYARCAEQHNTAAIASLHDSYLESADQFITFSRGLSQNLYGRDIPYVLLLHVGAFDAKMLPELIALFRQRGFQFVTLPQAQADPAYSLDPDIAFPGGGLLLELQATQHKTPQPSVPPDRQTQLDALCP
jgi:peptidoglycan/xylan/chitin deacetylase (PgdA/CDA1 family)